MSRSIVRSSPVGLMSTSSLEGNSVRGPGLADFGVSTGRLIVRASRVLIKWEEARPAEANMRGTKQGTNRRAGKRVLPSCCG